mgnify:CR=1 FL=1
MVCSLLMSQPMRQPMFTCLQNNIGRNAQIARKDQLEQLPQGTIHCCLPAILAQKAGVRNEQDAEIDRSGPEGKKAEPHSTERQP